MSIFSPKKKKQVIGYRYKIGMHMVAGHGNIDECEKIRVGEKVVWSSSDLSPIDYNNGGGGSGDSVAGALVWRAQTFTASSSYLSAYVSLSLYRAGSPGTLIASIQGTDVNGHPDGNNIAVYSFNANNLTTDTAGEWRNLYLKANLVSGTKYAIVLKVLAGDGSNYVKWRLRPLVTDYTGGCREITNNGGASWTSDTANDFLFEVYTKAGILPDTEILYDSATNVTTSLSVTPQGWVAQTFTPTSSYTLSSVELMLYRASGHTPGTLTLSLRAVDGSGHPTGDDLTKATTDGDSLPTVAALSTAEWRKFRFDFPVILAAGTKYALVLRPTESSTTDSVYWIASGVGGVLANGNNETSSDDGVTWTTDPNNRDMAFKAYCKPGAAPNKTITISQDNIFGGDRKDGGISGDVDFMFGASDQLQNSYLTNKLDSDIPAFRGLFSAVLNQVYIGTSPYLKPWSFLLKRVGKKIDGTTQWYPEKAVIRPRQEAGDDLNAAHILRECLTALEWGLGWDETDIDDASWEEAANILYDEGFGLSMLWDQVEPIEDFVDEILNYIAGILYQDLSTGKWVLSLTRDRDYSVAYDGYITGDDGTSFITAGSTRRLAQTFTTSKNYTPASIKIKAYELAAGNSFNVRCEIQSVDADGDPDGTVLAYGTIPNSSLTTSAAWVTCTLTSTTELAVNTKYALVVYTVGGAGTFYWRKDIYSAYAGGHHILSENNGSSWTKTLYSDFVFEIYAGGQLTTYDASDIIDVEDFSRPTIGEITDVVTVKFWDKLNHRTRSTEDRDLALISKQGGKIIEKILNYQGICDATLANAVAARELRLQTAMLAGVRLRCKRNMSHLKPNDLFILSWPKLDITQMTLRVLDADYGDLHNNEVILTCAEDEFAEAPTVYGDASDSLLIDPISAPINVTNRLIIEIPYWSLVNDVFKSRDLVDALDVDFTRMAVIAGKPSSDSFDFDLWTRFSSSYEFIDVGQGNNSFCPFGTITDALAQDSVDVDITLATDTDLDDVTVGSYAVIGNEIVLVNSVNTTTKVVNISRGILDSVPIAHNAGSVIYFAGLHYVDVEEEYTAGDTPDAKLLTRTGEGILDINSATTLSATAFDSRAIRPYPPGNLKFNGFRFPTYISSGAYGNKITISWNHRDRTDVTQLNSKVLHTDSTNFGPEAGTTYEIKVYDSEDSLGRTVTGLSGTSYDYTEAFEIADFGSLQETLRFEIYSTRGGYDSFYMYDVTIKRSLRGSIASTSSLSGYLVPSLDGRNQINASSSASGTLSAIINLAGSVSGSSSVSANLDASQTLVGSSASSSGTTGQLNIPQALKEYYTTGMNTNGVAYWFGPTDRWIAQTFTASSDYDIGSAILLMYKTAGSPGNVTVAIRATDGSGLPTGGDLCSATLNANDFTTDSNGEEITWNFGSPASLTNGTVYAIVLKSPAAESTYVRWKLDSSGASYAGGKYCWSLNGGSSWSSDSGADLWFENYRS